MLVGSEKLNLHFLFLFSFPYRDKKTYYIFKLDLIKKCDQGNGTLFEIVTESPRIKFNYYKLIIFNF